MGFIKNHKGRCIKSNFAGKTERRKESDNECQFFPTFRLTGHFHNSDYSDSFFYIWIKKN